MAVGRGVEWGRRVVWLDGVDAFRIGFGLVWLSTVDLPLMLRMGWSTGMGIEGSAGSAEVLVRWVMRLMAVGTKMMRGSSCLCLCCLSLVPC